jgi:uncharacterized iron-regulated membrane protein
MTENLSIPSPGATSSPLAWRMRARQIWLAVHRWIGLLCGALFVLVGLTGSALVYRQPLDEALNAMMRVTPPSDGAAYLSLDEIFWAAKAEMPRHGVATSISMPRNATAAVAVSYRAPNEDDEPTSHKIYVDPYTAAVTGDKLIKTGDDEMRQAAINSLISLHHTLWLGSGYGYVVGIPALFLLASILFGIWLWWPKPGQWRLAFAIKPGAGAERRLFDLHRVFGAFFAALLCLSLFSGIYMTFRPQTRELVRLFSPVRDTPRLASQPTADQEPIGLDEAVRIAEGALPRGKLISIALPTTEKGAYVVGVQTEGEPSRTFTRNRVTVDQYSGAILDVENRSSYTAGERFLEWLLPLHTGEAFGDAGRAVMFAVGLMPAFLYVTGFILWRRRTRRLAADA